MKFRVSHEFAVDRQTYLQLIDDPEFEALLARESKVERVVTELREEAGVRHKRVRCTPDRELPGFVAKLVGSSRIVYDQVNEVDLQTGLLRWRVEPRVAAGKLDIAGTMRLHDRPGGVERVVEGEVVVRVPLVGGQIEKTIVADVQRSYDKAAAALRRWIAERGS